MKIIFRNSNLIFEARKPKKFANLNEGYAYSSQFYVPETGSVLIDLVTGDDITTRQVIFAGAYTGDFSGIELLNGIFTAGMYGSSKKNLYTSVKANTRYKIVLNYSKKMSYLFDSENNLLASKSMGEVGTNKDNVFILGVARVEARTLPFYGWYAYACISDNIDSVTNFVSNPDRSDIVFVADNIDINSKVWKDSKSEKSLQLYNTPSIEILNV